MDIIILFLIIISFLFNCSMAFQEIRNRIDYIKENYVLLIRISMAPLSQNKFC